MGSTTKSEGIMPSYGQLLRDFPQYQSDPYQNQEHRFLNRFLKALPFIADLTWCYLQPAQADEKRYISIRNTDTVWTPGNICVYQFRLDNGGSGTSFGQLNVSLHLKDKAGKTLAQGVMEVAPFGESDATRSQDAFLEHECVEGVSALKF